MRVKGDGRNYYINLGTGMYYDVNWFTMFSYAIFTHGGPYWQTIRVSNFYKHSLFNSDVNIRLQYYQILKLTENFYLIFST